jgi:hypothetical protein
VQQAEEFYGVIGKYILRGDIGPNVYTREVVIDITYDIDTLNQIREHFYNHQSGTYLANVSPSVRAQLHQDPQLHVKRYRMNDIMPTMNLDDYDLKKHKQQLKTITTELAKHFHSKKIKDALEDIRAIQNAPPSRVLPNGSLEYRELISDPAFIKRWGKNVYK